METNRDITEKKRVNEILKKSEHDLKEMIKELNCLYGISKIIDLPDLSIQDIISLTLNHIPTAWQFPDIICTRITYKDKEYKTENFKETDWKILTIIDINQNPMTIEVFYTEEKSFLEEEKYFLNDIGYRIKVVLEKRETENKLGKSEKKFRFLFENAADAIIWANLKTGIILNCNKAIEGLLGRTKGEIIGQHHSILHPSGLEENFMSSFKRKLKIPRNKRDETQVITKSGKIKTVQISGSIVELSGEPIIQGIFRDITEIKIAEQRLKESEEKFRVFAEQTIMGIVLIQDNAIKHVNEAMSKINEYSIEEMINWTPMEFRNRTHPDDVSAIMDRMKGRQEGDKKLPNSFIFRIITKSGKIKWIESYSKTILFWGKFADLASVIDITEKIEAEQKLKESEEKYRKFLTRFQGIAYQGNLDFTISFIEGTVEEITGYLKEDFLSGNLRWDQIVHHEDLEIINKEDSSLIKNDPNFSKEREYRIIRKDGQVKWIREYIQNVCDLNGKLSFIEGTIYDITEKKEAEQELITLNNLKSELLRRASHELKTPLVSIKGNADLLLNVHHEKFDDNIISYLEDIKGGCSRLEDLIRDLIESSRFESDQIKLNPTMEDLSFLIKFCVRELKGLTNGRNQQIIMEIHDELITLFEKERFYIVLINLLSNAIKYTPPNGIIKIKSEIKELFYLISIEDNGIGFSEKEMTQIFKQFGKIERYGQGLDLGIEGSGLGLFITRKIVELHGGKIWVESEGKNTGSTFYFTLPRIRF